MVTNLQHFGGRGVGSALDDAEGADLKARPFGHDELDRLSLVPGCQDVMTPVRRQHELALADQLDALRRCAGILPDDARLEFTRRREGL